MLKTSRADITVLSGCVCLVVGSGIYGVYRIAWFSLFSLVWHFFHLHLVDN